MAGLSEFSKKDKLAFVNIEDGSSKELQFLAEVADFDYFCEHNSPKEWWKSAVCTYDTGSCWACEQQERNWNQKIRIYVPVLYQNKPAVLSQGMGNNSVVHSLLEYYADHGTILDTRFVVAREGKGKRTKYTATPIDNSEPIAYNKNISLSELKKSIDYDAQANYYK